VARVAQRYWMVSFVRSMFDATGGSRLGGSMRSAAALALAPSLVAHAVKQ